MRDILFRGKRVDDGQWVEGDLVHRYDFSGNLEYEYENAHIKPIGKNELEVIPETVGQFTGLLDKNGKKIFEGDILRHSDKFESIIAKVIYERMGYRLIGLKEPIYWNFHSEFEIIGNIHDNSELLCK